MASFSRMKVLWVTGGPSATYPEAALGSEIRTDAVTLVNTEALNFNATETLISHFAFAGARGDDTIGLLNFWDVRTGAFMFSWNYDEEPNTDAVSPIGSKPRNLEFGTSGLRFQHGFGLSLGSATATVGCFYRDII